MIRTTLVLFLRYTELRSRFFLYLKQCSSKRLAGCLSPDPNPTITRKEEREKISGLNLFYNLSQLTKNYSTFCPKIVTDLSAIWVRDPGSGKKPG
jgi:hypothetical protein